MKIRLTEMTIGRDELSRLTTIEKKRYVMIACFFRDFSLLSKCLAYTQNTPIDDPPIRAAASQSQTFFIITLMTKVHEIHTFYEENDIYEECEALSGPVNEHAQLCQGFFAVQRVNYLFEFVRDKLGFHYSSWDDIDPEVEEALDHFDVVGAWMSEENSTNEFFGMSSAVILRVILTEMEKLIFLGDREEMMGTLMDLTLDGAKLLKDFTARYLAKAFDIKWQGGPGKEYEVPAISEVTLPFIVARDQIDGSEV